VSSCSITSGIGRRFGASGVGLGKTKGLYEANSTSITGNLAERTEHVLLSRHHNPCFFSEGSGSAVE
jgi:hypothetical protein